MSDAAGTVAAGSPVGFLAGLRVLELGDGIAGAAATNLLAVLGADVVSVVDPDSPHRHGRPSAMSSDGPHSLLALILDRGKTLRRTDAAHDLGALLESERHSVDLVIVDRVAGARGALAGLTDLDEYVDFVDRHNPAAWLTISAFGLSGPRRADVASELTIAAASGMLGSVRDATSGRPLKLAGYQSLLNTGQAAALAACHAVDLARDRTPIHLDLAAVEATVATGPVLEAVAVLLNAGGPGGAKRYGAPASFYPCSDGLVRISAMEDHQWHGVVAALGSPDWAERFATTEARIDGHQEIDERIAAWSRSRSKIEAETLLQSHGVPATAMYSPREALESPQLRHRAVFERVELGDGRSVEIVGGPVRRVAGSPQTEAAVRRRSLRGLKVLEVSHVLAAPLAGALLGALGAQVTKLEDLRRIDMYRRRGPYIDNEPGSERSAYFALVNHSKDSCAFDVEAAPERLAAILAATDVVIENLGGKRATRLGVASTEMATTHPGVLAISSSGYGQDGPFASYRAYAYNLQASGCLGYLTRNEHGESAEIDLPWADLVSAYALATLVAAWAVGPAGNRGAALDFAMSDVVVARFNEFVAAASLDPDSDAMVDRANEMFPFAPNGVYPTNDGWVAVTVEDDEQYQRLVKLIDKVVLTGPGLETATGRFDARAALDDVIVAYTRDATAVAIAGELRGAGIVAEEVVAPRALPEVAQLVDRGFFTPVDHPVWGRRRLVGVPWRRYGEHALPLHPSPVLEPIDG